MKIKPVPSCIISVLFALQHGCSAAGVREGVAIENEGVISGEEKVVQEIILDRITCDKDYLFSLKTGKEYSVENGELELTPLESKSKYIDEDDEGQKVVYNYAYFDFKAVSDGFVVEEISGFNHHYLDTSKTVSFGNYVVRKEFNTDKLELTRFSYYQGGEESRFDAERLWVWEPFDRNWDLVITNRNHASISKCSKVEDFVFKFFPFSPSPRMFQEHINSMSWGDASRRVFDDLSSCESMPFKRKYKCSSGFLTRNDRLGDKICRLDYVKYDKGKIDFSVLEGNDSCRWK